MTQDDLCTSDIDMQHLTKVSLAYDQQGRKQKSPTERYS